MKRILLTIFAISCSFSGYSQHDPQAILIIERMSAVIGEISSFSFTMTNCKDVSNSPIGMQTICNHHELFINGPTKMLVKSSGDNGNREIYYNGETFNYFNLSENNYVTLSAPPTLIETLDTLHKLYEFDFPAADFFYPTFPEDLQSFCEKISYAGESAVNGIPCHLISAENKEMYIQIWIRKDAGTFPQRLVINYKKGKNMSRYETILSEWKLDRELPPSMFDFLPAPGARKVSILTSTIK